MPTKQENFWSGEFGQEYTARNSHSIEEWNKFYLDNWGVSKIDMNEKSLRDVSIKSKILEVGSNTGMQLRGLQTMGYENLYGVELQHYAVEESKKYTQNINIVQGSGFDLPFKDKFFDVVFTNGVLIHISPDDLPRIMDEMYRCSSKYIWGWEYYAEETTSINYRGNEGFLWKADYAKLFMDRFPDLKMISFQDYPYVTENEKGNTDRMYLLAKS